MVDNEQLFKLTQQLGHCVGKLDQFCEAQQTLNEKIQENIEKLDAKREDANGLNEKRITDLESSRTSLYSVVIGTGLTSGGFAAWMAKILGITGGGQ